MALKYVMREDVEKICIIRGEGGILVSITSVICLGINVGIAEQNYIPDTIVPDFFKTLKSSSSLVIWNTTFIIWLKASAALAQVMA